MSLHELRMIFGIPQLIPAIYGIEVIAWIFNFTDFTDRLRYLDSNAEKLCVSKLSQLFWGSFSDLRETQHKSVHAVVGNCELDQLNNRL